MGLPQRKNGQTIDASWFQSIHEAISERESSHDIAANQAATALSGQVFDGAAISSVVYEYEVALSTTIFATGRLALHYKNGTWRKIDGGFEGEDHALGFSVDQAGSVGTLKVAETLNLDGVLKLKRRTFDVEEA